MSTSTSDIKAVLNGIAGMAEQDSTEAYRSVANNKAVEKAVAYAKAGDQKGFYIDLIYPFQKIVDGLLAEATTSSEAKFLLKHGDFVERHLKMLIQKYEGLAYCADKSRTIIRSLLQFHLVGKEIRFDYNQEVTYHFPKKIFTSHDEIVEFAKSLYHLYYGQPKAYLSALASVVHHVWDETEHERGTDNV